MENMKFDEYLKQQYGDKKMSIDEKRKAAAILVRIGERLKWEPLSATDDQWALIDRIIDELYRIHPQQDEKIQEDDDIGKEPGE